jgi:predicted metal-dependent hydrolase
VIDARTRWGSCSPPRAGAPHGRIRYSWRLVLAPPAVLDYVAAHEVAHLAEPNHSPAFWAVCADLYGDVAPARRWLKQNGAALHAVD